MATMTKAQLETALEQTLARLAAIEASLREATTIQTAAPATTNAASKTAKATTASTADKESGVKHSEVIGTIAYIAQSGKGLQLVETGSHWHNVRSKAGKPIFHNGAVGQTVKLGLNAAGRVVTVVFNPGTSKMAATTTAPLGAVVAPPAARVSKAGEVVPNCPFCKGADHKNYSRDQVAFECAARQYATAHKGEQVQITNAVSMGNYVEWLRITPVTVFAHDKAGSFQIGAAPKGAAVSAPTAPTMAATALSDEALDMVLSAKTAARRAAKAAVITPAAKAEAEKAPKFADVVAPGKPELGKIYKGYVNKHSRNTPGLIRFVSAELPGHDGNGIWIGSSEKLASQIAKLAVGDRIAIEVGGIKSADGQMIPGIVRGKLLGSIVKESGVTPGVQTSGKQDAPTPKTQGTDSKVKAARVAARVKAQAARDADKQAAAEGGEVAA